MIYKNALWLAVLGLMIGIVSAEVLTSYTEIDGTAEIEEPVFYLNEDAGLQLSPPREKVGSFPSSETFKFELDGTEFYGIEASVYLSNNTEIDTVEFDYDDGQGFMNCGAGQESGSAWRYSCDQSMPSFNPDEFSLRIEGTTGLELVLGSDTRVEVDEK